jgi:hypothetical protein
VLDKAMETAVGALDRRFLLTAFVPTAVFLACLAAFTWPGHRQWSAVAKWQQQDAKALTTQLLGFFAVALLASVLLASVASSITRFFEGYWRGPVGRFAALVGRRYHHGVLDRLGRAAPTDPAADRRISLSYPLPVHVDEVMPTTLGNVLRNAEYYPRDRYGIEAIVVWPRLYLVVPDRALAGLAASRGDLELHLTVATLATVFGCVAAVHELVRPGPWWAFPLVFGLPMLFAWLNYRAAVAAAITYGTHLKAVFDVHRQELLQRFADAATEPEPQRWQRLVQLWYRGVPTDVDLEPPAPPGPPAPTSVTATAASPAAAASPAPKAIRGQSGARLSHWFAIVVAVGSCVGALLTALR